MNLYSGKKVKTQLGTVVYMLIRPDANPDLWLAKLQNDDLERLLLTDNLIPALKEGDTVEAILLKSHSNRQDYNGFYTLIKEELLNQTAYTWKVKNTATLVEQHIHETWLWPIANKPVEPNSCTCNITDLMRYGCKCGQFQREQNDQPNTRI